jgi:hypothetical protein
MEGLVKQAIVGLGFALSVSAVSGALTYSQMRTRDDHLDKKESNSNAAVPVQARRVSGLTRQPQTSGELGTNEGPDPGPATGIAEALGFQGDGGKKRGQGHYQHGNGFGYGHDHHDDDNRPPVSPAHPGHGRGKGHDRHGNGLGRGHDHHQH